MSSAQVGILIPGNTTLATIVGLAAREADQPQPTPTTFISISEAEAYANASIYELTGLLVEMMGDYYVAGVPYILTTDGINDQFALPADFFKLLGVDQIVTPGIPQSAITLKTFAYGERNRYNVPYFPILPGLTNLRYRISGNNLWMIPSPPAANQQIRVRYVPRSLPLSTTGVITFNGLLPGDLLSFSLTYGGSGSGFWNFAATSGPFGATVFNGGGPTYTDIQSAINFAVRFNGLVNPLVAQATAGIAADGISGTVSIQLNTPGSVTWSSTTTNAFAITLSPMPYTAGSVPDQAVPSWQNVLDGVNGWEEYVVIDVAMKMMAKEESDTSVLERRKAAIIRRLEAEAANRDMGMPAHVVDVPDYDGGNGSNGAGGMFGGW